MRSVTLASAFMTISLETGKKNSTGPVKSGAVVLDALQSHRNASRKRPMACQVWLVGVHHQTRSETFVDALALILRSCCLSNLD